MTRPKKRKRQHGCKVIEAIDTIEKTASTAMKIYKALEPIAKAILASGRRTK
jgi:hypothetical protein